MKNIPFTENEIKEIKDHYSQELDRIEKRATEIRGILQKMGSAKIVESVKSIKIAGKSVNKIKGKASKKVVNEVTPTLTVAETKIEEIATTKKNAPKKSVKTLNKKAGKAKVLKVKASKSKTAKTDNKAISKKEKAISKAPVIKVSKIDKRALKSANAEIKRAKIVKGKSATEKKGRKKSSDSKKSHYESYILGLLSKQGKMLTSKAIFDAVEKEYNVPAADYSKMKATVTVILSKEKANGLLKDYPQPGTKAKLYGISEWFDEKGILKDVSKMK